MKIHNLMEELVLNKVEEFFNDEQNARHIGCCTSLQCQYDVACYVLNRIRPLYVISGRGLAHHENHFKRKVQEESDISALVLEGMRKISQTMRPHAEEEDSTLERTDKEGCFFNIPVIQGKLFNGKNFSPIQNVEISLFNNKDKLVSMKNLNWQNPYRLSAKTSGTYLFWPEPLEAEKEGLLKEFSFELRVADPRYESFIHLFTIKIESKNEYISIIQASRLHKIEDLYLFPANDTD